MPDPKKSQLAKKAALAPKPVRIQTDPTMDIASPTLGNYIGDNAGKLIVQKDDGSIGQWGNDLNNAPVSSKYRLTPAGEMDRSDYDYLRSLKDDKLNDILDNPIQQSATHVPLFGASESDVIKGLLAKKPVTDALGGKTGAIDPVMLKAMLFKR